MTNPPISSMFDNRYFKVIFWHIFKSVHLRYNRNNLICLLFTSLWNLNPSWGFLLPGIKQHFYMTNKPFQRTNATMHIIFQLTRGPFVFDSQVIYSTFWSLSCLFFFLLPGWTNKNAFTTRCEVLETKSGIFFFVWGMLKVVPCTCEPLMNFVNCSLTNFLWDQKRRRSSGGRSAQVNWFSHATAG